MRLVVPGIVYTGLIVLSIQAEPIEAEKVISCRVSPGQVATLFRERGVADTYIYRIQQGNQAPTLLYESEEESRGAEVQAQCVGRRAQVLVVSGQFSSNYLQGFSLRFNTTEGAWERINFSERGRPSFVYVSETNMSVVIPNLGNETDKKYLLYTYVAGIGQAKESAAVDHLPSSGRKLRLHPWWP